MRVVVAILLILGLSDGLIAESAERFRVPDNGSAMTFFRAATGQAGLWASQRIWRKLPETTTGVNGSREPEANRSASESRSAVEFLVFRNGPSWGRRGPDEYTHLPPAPGCAASISARSRPVI